MFAVRDHQLHLICSALNWNVGYYFVNPVYFDCVSFLTKTALLFPLCCCCCWCFFSQIIFYTIKTKALDMILIFGALIPNLHNLNRPSMLNKCSERWNLLMNSMKIVRKTKLTTISHQSKIISSIFFLETHKKSITIFDSAPNLSFIWSAFVFLVIVFLC